jgi:hypothetical protein
VVALRQLIEEAVKKEVRRGQAPIGEGRGWLTPPANVPREEIWRIQRLIDEEFRTIESDEE